MVVTPANPQHWMWPWQGSCMGKSGNQMFPSNNTCILLCGSAFASYAYEIILLFSVLIHATPLCYNTRPKTGVIQSDTSLHW